MFERKLRTSLQTELAERAISTPCSMPLREARSGVPPDECGSGSEESV